MSIERLYSRPIILNSEKHKDSKVKLLENFDIFRNLDSCIILCQEFFDAAKYYPIVFTESVDGAVIPVVMLGMNKNEFVDDEGKWEDGTYIPAFVRRYPFILVENKDDKDKLAVAVDAGYDGFNTEDGVPLFNKDGNYTDFLKANIEFLKLFHAGYQLTLKFTQKLKDYGLFKKEDINIRIKGNKFYTVKDAMIVDEKKIGELSEEQIVDMVKPAEHRQFIAWIYIHLYSLFNFSKLTKN